MPGQGSRRYVDEVFDGLTTEDLRAGRVVLRGNEFEGCTFTTCDLSACLFEECDLSGADWRTARKYFISPNRNRIKGLHVSLPEALSLLAAIDVLLE